MIILTFLELRKQEDVGNLRKLFDLSQEYMLKVIEQRIYQELIHKTKSLMATKDMEYAIPLFILADEVHCGEAIDNCLRFISENLNIHQYWDSHHFHTEISETWRLLVKEKNLGKNSKAKLIGLKVIKDLNKKNCDLDRARTELNIIAGVLMDFN